MTPTLNFRHRKIYSMLGFGAAVLCLLMISGCSQEEKDQSETAQGDQAAVSAPIAIKPVELKQNEIYKTNIPLEQNVNQPYVPWLDTSSSSEKEPGDEEESSEPVLM